MCRVCLFVVLLVGLVGCQTARRTVQLDSDTRSPRYAVEFASGHAEPEQAEQVAGRSVNDENESEQNALSASEQPVKRSRQWPNPLARFIPATVSSAEDAEETSKIEGREAF